LATSLAKRAINSLFAHAFRNQGKQRVVSRRGIALPSEARNSTAAAAPTIDFVALVPVSTLSSGERFVRVGFLETLCI